MSLLLSVSYTLLIKAKQKTCGVFVQYLYLSKLHESEILRNWVEPWNLRTKEYSASGRFYLPPKSFPANGPASGEDLRFLLS